MPDRRRFHLFPLLAVLLCSASCQMVKKSEPTAEMSINRYIVVTACTRIFGLNSELDEFVRCSLDIADGDYVDQFTTLEYGDVLPSDIRYVEPPKDRNDPRWVFSPDESIAVTISLYDGDPDNSLDIYNRKGDKQVEHLRFCGTPCVYLRLYWISDSNFVLVESLEYEPRRKAKENPFALVVISYDLEEMTVTALRSRQFKSRHFYPYCD
jgi:hypothetical protein